MDVISRSSIPQFSCLAERASDHPAFLAGLAQFAVDGFENLHDRRKVFLSSANFVFMRFAHDFNSKARFANWLSVASSIISQGRAGCHPPGRANRASRFSLSSARHHPHAPGTRQTALLSLERSDARFETWSAQGRSHGVAAPRGDFKLFAPAFYATQWSAQATRHLLVRKDSEQTVFIWCPVVAREWIAQA
jgi:hypothetical protein